MSRVPTLHDAAATLSLRSRFCSWFE